MKNFLNFIKEELKISKIDPDLLLEIKSNIIRRLEEYKRSIIDNIFYDTSTNSISSINFENINFYDIVKDMSEEFEEVFSDLNIEAFLRKIHQILELKKRNTKKLIKDEFVEYYISLDKRIDKIINSDKNVSNYHFGESEGEKSLITRKEFENEKYDIQVELIKLQEWVIKNNKRVAIVFEGRDASGKGSTIKRFTEYLMPKGFKIVAMGIPTEEEKNNWFARYEKHMPNNGEIIFFDRSWYNRAVVEPSLGYCTEDQYKNFMEDVNQWENDLIDDGLILIKFWFSITKEKQLQRFDLRQKSPLVYWKYSPNDAKVTDKWDIISKYKNQMFNKTATPNSPWVIINTNDKKTGMLNAMRYVLWDIDYDNKNYDICEWYPEVVSVIK